MKCIEQLLLQFALYKASNYYLKYVTDNNIKSAVSLSQFCSRKSCFLLSNIKLHENSIQNSFTFIHQWMFKWLNSYISDHTYCWDKKQNLISRSFKLKRLSKFNYLQMNTEWKQNKIFKSIDSRSCRSSLQIYMTWKSF